MISGADRVKNHRAKKRFIRVEVQVPTTDDAAAIRRFAQDRRRHPNAPQVAPKKPPAPPMAPTETLDAILPSLGAEALNVLRIFAEGLERAPTPELLARGWRVAENYRDAAAMAACNAESLAPGDE